MRYYHRSKGISPLEKDEDDSKKESVILKSITREEMIKDGRLDIYAFIRSDDIREYMREYRTFDIHDKLHIIFKSMNPFPMKIEALKILAKDPDLSERQRRHVLCVTKYVEDIFTEIHSEQTKAIIGMRECRAKSLPGDEDYKALDEFEASIEEDINAEFFSSYKEFRRKYYIDAYEPGIPLSRFEFSMIYKDIPWCDNTPIHFSATWFEDRFDDRFEIYSVSVDAEWGETLGYRKSITEYLDMGEHAERYSLPFGALTRVKFKTPFMRRAISGILDSSMDCGGCWYHSFYPTEGDKHDTGMDWSYHWLDTCLNYTVFDFVTRDNGDITDEEMEGIVWPSRFIDVVSIEQMKKDRHGTILGRVKKIKKNKLWQSWKIPWATVHVELEDPTGTVEVPIKIEANDMLWLTKPREGVLVETSVSVDIEEGNRIVYAGSIRPHYEKYFKKHLMLKSVGMSPELKEAWRVWLENPSLSQ